MLDHTELRLEIARRIADFGGKASAPEIKRNFRHNTKHKNAIDDALQDMVMSEMLEKVWVGNGRAQQTSISAQGMMRA